jgi:hemolysin activation/secretion protein
MERRGGAGKNLSRTRVGDAGARRSITAALSVCGVVALGAPGAVAQVTATPTAPLQVPPIERVVPPPTPQFTPPRPEVPTTVEPAEDGRQVHLDEAVIEGMTVYPAETIRPIYAPLVGQTVTEAQINAALQQLQLLYNRDGYILTTVRGGVEPVDGRNRLVIRVIEGFISDVKLEGDIGSAGVLVYRYLQNLTEIRPVRIADLERYLLLAQDVPGVGVRAVLRPATGEAGAVELVAQVSRRPFSGYASYDNRGSDFAGPSEVLVGAAEQSFTSLGERLEAQFFNTLNRDQLFGQASGQMLLGSEGLRLRGYVGAGNSQPGGPLAATGYDGDLLVGGLGLTYPMIRTRPLTLLLSGDFDVYESSVDLLGPAGVPERQSNSRLRVLRGGGQLNSQDALLGGGFPAANLAIVRVHHGLIGLGSSENDSTLPARPGNKIDFTKFTGEVSRIQNLLRFGEIGTALQVTVAGQYTNDILPPSEKFFLGGIRFGRGFFSGEITGDRAFGASVEFQVNTSLPSPADVLGEGGRLGTQFYAFYDQGRSFDLAPGDVDRTLESAGLGARVNLNESVSTELEGVRRFTLKPTGENVSAEKSYAVFGRIVARF